jgi:hypothetical protein
MEDLRPWLQARLVASPKGHLLDGQKLGKRSSVSGSGWEWPLGDKDFDIERSRKIGEYRSSIREPSCVGVDSWRARKAANEERLLPGK